MSEITRRDMLRLSVLAAAGLTLPPSRAALAQALNTDVPHPIQTQGFSYFTPAEIAFLKAAVDRLIPKDDLGPGALDAGVVFFLDQQMVGPYGQAETWYMQGPWREGTSEQGYQYKLTPAQLYRASIRAIDTYCRQTYGGKTFAQLSANDQEKVLQGLDEKQITLADAPAKDFMDLLWKNTTEGFFADPVYGGNRDFISWKLVGFPGPRYNYVNEIDQYGKRYTLPIVGLMGREVMNGRKA